MVGVDPVEVLHPDAGVVVAHAPPVAGLVIDGPGAQQAGVLAGVLVAGREGDGDVSLVPAVEHLCDAPCHGLSVRGRTDTGKDPRGTWGEPGTHPVGGGAVVGRSPLEHHGDVSQPQPEPQADYGGVA